MTRRAIPDIRSLGDSAGGERRMVLTPFDAREALTLQEAAKLATVSETTIARWCNEFHIGRKIGGTWRVSRVALHMKLDDNGWALVAYLDGDRTSQRVTQYFFDLGLANTLPMSTDVPRDDCGERKIGM